MQSRLARDYSLGVYSTLSDNFAGDRIEERHAWNFGATFLNFWGVNLFGSFSPTSLTDRLLRGGPIAGRPSATVTRLSTESDPRKPVVVSSDISHSTDVSGMALELAKLEVDWRPAPQARVRLAPTYQNQRITGQYVQVVRDPLATSTFGSRYIFANVRQHELSVDVRLDWTFSPWLSLRLFLQPFAASGRFSRFNEFTTPRQFAFSEYGVDKGTVTRLGDGSRAIDPDGTGAAPSFVEPNQDFTVRALRGNAVLRWEYRPGSSLFFVWTQQRAERFDDVRSNVSAQALRTFADPGRHVFLFRFSRWIGS